MNIFKSKIWIMSLILMFGYIPLWATPVLLDDARNVAINWMSEKIGKNFQIDTKKHVSNSLNVKSIDHSDFFRIIKLKPQGWVIVSSDDIAKPIIGYGESSLDTTELPVAFVNWMEAVEENIQNGIQNVSVRSLDIDVQLTQKNISSEWIRLTPREILGFKSPNQVHFQ